MKRLAGLAVAAVCCLGLVYLSGSAGAQTAPGAPTVASVTTGAGSLTVTWTAPASDGGSPVTSYDLRHIETVATDRTDGDWTVEEGVWTSGDLSHTVAGLTDGVDYDVEVRAANATGPGAWSATASGTTRDHPDRQSAATTLVLDSSLPGRIDPGDDEDLFEIVLTEDTDLWVYTTGDLDTVGKLTDSRGDVLASNNQGRLPPRPRNFSLRAEVGPGTYYVSVLSNKGAHAGAYRIHTVAARPASNLNPRTVSLGSLTPGRMVLAGWVERFEVTVTEDTDLWVLSIGETATRGELYGAGGDLIVRADGSSLPGNSRGFTFRAQVEAGTYDIRVEGRGVHGGGPYILYVQAVGLRDSRDTAAPLTFDLAAPGRMDSAGDEDYFSLALAAPTNLILSTLPYAHSHAVPLTVTLVDGDGNETEIYTVRSPPAPPARDRSAGFRSTARTRLGAGVHHFRVTSPDGDTGPYMLLPRVDVAAGDFEEECLARGSSQSDPLYGCQWHLNNTGQYGRGAGQDINVEGVWAATMGEGVNVAVVDAPVDLRHGSTSGFRSVSELEVTGSRLTIRDDDTVGVTVTPTELAVGEGRSSSYRVRLNTQPGGDVTVTVDGYSGTELTVSPDTLTFTADSWSIDQAVTVTAAEDDDAVTDDETKLTHTVTGSDYEGVAAADVVVSITEDDTPGVTLTPEDLDVDEGTSSTYTVVLDTEPTADVTITIGGHSGTDITLSATTLVFATDTWDTAQTITVTAGEDDDAASDDSVTLTHTAAGGGYAGVRESVTVTIIEGDTSVLSIDDAGAAEDGGQVVFTVTISAAAGTNVTVGYATSDVTATAGADYTHTSGTLTFPANSVASQTVSVPVTDDGVDEAEEETFTLTLSNAQGASLAGGGTTLEATGTIGDNDDPTVTANFASDAYTVDEGSSVDVAVTLSTDPERRVTIPITTTGRGGVSNSDYSGVPDNVVFEIGDTQKTITVTATPDDIDDDNETVTLRLGTLPDRVTGGATPETTVTIEDDDTAGITTSESTLSIDEGTSSTYTVVLDTEPTADVTITIGGHSGTDITLSGATLSNNALVFTSTNWNTAQTITVTAGADDDAASDDSVTLTHTAAGGDYAGVRKTVTVTIIEGDASVLSIDDVTGSESAGELVFTVAISAAAGSNVTVAYATSDGTATAPADYTHTSGTLTFPANSVAAQTVSVPVIDDTDDEAEEETFTLTLSNAQGASLAGGGTTLTATGTIGDNDDPTVTANFASDAYSIDEGSSTEVAVTLSTDPERRVTIPLTTTGQGGVSNDDYTGIPQNVVFENGETEKTFTVTATPDDIDDDGETVTLQLENFPNHVTGGTTTETTVTIEDDDTAGVTIDPTALTVVAGQSNGYSVVLDTQPTGDVTITIGGHTGTDITLSGATLSNDALVFTSENWDTAQTITAAAGSDAGTASVTLTHAVSGGDYNSTKADDVAVAIIGGPQELVIQVGVTASQEDLTVPEGGSNAYSLVLSSAPTGDVTIGVGVPTGNDLSTVQESLTFTTSNWNRSQTVTVSAGEDDDAIADDAVVITHTISGGGYADTAVPGVRVTIIENDTPGVTITPMQLTIGEGETGEYTVVLDTRPSATVTVAIGGYSGTDLSVSPAGSLTFTTADWNRSQTVTVSADEDDDTNADPAVTLTHTVTGGDYDGQAAAGVTVTVTENDQDGGPTPGDPAPEDPPPEDPVTVSFEKDYHHVAEGAPGGAGVGVVLSAAVESEVTVQVVVLAQSTAGAADYSGVPDEVTFAPGETYTHFQVVPVLEAVEEDDEQVFLGFGPLPEEVGAGHYDQTYVTIFDAALLSFGSSTYVATEGGDRAVVAVRLSKPLPLGQVIPLTAEAGNGATGDDWSGVPSEVHFAAGETVKTFTVTAVDDTVEDDGEKVTLGFGTLRDRLIAVPPARATVTLMNMENGFGYEDPPESTPTPCTGTSLTVGTVYTGTIDTAGETDWWKVDLEPYKSYVIYTRGAETGQGTLARPETLQFVRSGSSFLTARRHSTAAGYPASSLAEFGITPYLPGSHCFEVGTRDDEPGTYAVEVVVDESTPNGYQSDVAADTSTRARIHSPVTSYMQTGFLGDNRGPGDDEDWYRVTLDGGVRYQIDVKADTRYEQRHRLTRPKVTGIHDSSGGAIVGTASTGTGTEVSVDFTPRRSGVYYIAVGSNSGDRDGMFLVCARSKAVADEDTCHMGDGPPPGYGPPRAPRNVRVSQGGSQELEVAWTRPSGTSGWRRNTTIIGYRVQWKEASDTWDDRSEVTTSARIPGPSYTIAGLAGGVEYAVRVLAFNFMGVGEASEEVTATAWQAQGSSLKSNNTPPTGGPGISGVPRVGEILTATTGGIADEDGLAGAVFDYQWIRHDPASGSDTRIDGAAEPGYTVTSDDAGKGLRVLVSFTDDAGNEESLISYTVVVQAPPLTAEFRNVPERHTGEDVFVVRILFSEGIEIKRKDFRAHALEVIGGSATRAQRVDGRRDLWEISIEPISDDDVSLLLPAGRSCDEAGAICTGDGRWLSNRLMLTVAGPEQQDPDPSDNTEQPQPDPPDNTEQPQPDPPDNTEQPQPDPPDDTEEPQPDPPDDTGQPQPDPPDDTEESQPDPLDDTEEPEEPQEPPPPPGNLTAVVNGDGTITLSWDSPDDDSVTGYQIHRIRPKLGDDSFVVYVEDTGSTATSFTDTATAPGTHIYRVMAINAAGVGKRSNYIAAAVP